MVVGTGGVAVLTLVRAVARRISAGPGAADGRREIDALRDEVDRLRAEVDGAQARLGELDDVQNRLDFAERMLAQVRDGKDKNALPGAR